MQIWLILVCLLLLSMKSAALPFVIWATVVTAVIAIREEKNNIIVTAISSALNAPAIQYIGKLSYSIYLSHMIVIVVCLDLLKKMGVTGTYLHAAALLALVLPLTILVSWASFTFFEKPFNDFGKSLFKSPAHMRGTGKLRNRRRVTPALGE